MTFNGSYEKILGIETAVVRSLMRVQCGVLQFVHSLRVSFLGHEQLVFLGGETIPIRHLKDQDAQNFELDNK